MNVVFNGIRRSLAWKLFLLGVVPAFFLLLLVAFVVIWSMESNLVRTSLQAIEAELNHAAHEVADINDEAREITETLVTANEAGLFGRRKEGLEISKAILEKHPQLTGVSMAYEPNADGGDEAWAKKGGLPEGALDANGRLVLYWFRNPDKGGTVDLAPLTGMETSYYYQGLKNRVEGRPESEGVMLDGKPAAEAVSQYYDRTRELEQDVGGAMLTEPYDYEGKLIVECVAPIRRNGKFVGMIGADRALGDLEEFLRKIKPFKSSAFFLVSLRGRIISATSDDMIRTKRFEDTPYREILHRFYSDANATAVEEVDPVTKKECYFAGVRVPDSGWTLVMRVDASEVLAPINMAIRNVLWITLSVGLVIVMVFSILFRSVLRRIHHAADTATRVAEGDLTVQVIEGNEDETGQLLKAIGRMVHDLHSVVSRVHQAGLQLSTTSDDLRAVSGKREDSVKTFGASSSEIAAAVQQISATSQELAKTMGDVTNVAGDTADLADRGRSKLAAMVDNSKELESATRSISSKLSVINEKASNINSVITTITKVADQTNLLSLNAAIEAEKAGEYGLGFSVVAREIRRLADQTAVATLDIEQMVKEMQSSVSAGVMEMDKFASAVIRGVEGSNDIASQLEQIIAQVQALTPRFETVTEGMESQSKGAQQINNAMTQLTGMARDAAMSATEFNQASQKLQSSVELLRQEVARFKLE